MVDDAQTSEQVSSGAVFLEPTSFDPRLAFEVLRASPAVTYVYDLTKQTSIFQNRHIGEVIGHARLDHPDPLGEWVHLMHPDDLKKFSAHRERLRVIRPGEVFSWEYRLRAPDESWRWYVSRDTLLANDSAGRPELIVGNATDISEQKNAERQKDILLDEMRHRSRNFAAVVAAIAEQTRPKKPEDGVAAYDAFAARLSALFRAGDLLMTTDDRTADIESVLQTAVSVFASSRVRFDGPNVTLVEQAAGGLTLIAHELATNATKYGALSASDGYIDVKWFPTTYDDDNALTLVWKEVGGPKVEMPTKQGFGTRLISSVLPKSRVSLDYAADGLRCEVVLTDGWSSASA